MPKHLPSTLGIIALFLASTALGAERSELENSTVKAATNCVAQAALNNPNITTLYQQNRLKEVTDWIVLKSSACDNPLRAMRLLHDRIYGEGTGRTFLRGDYLADLPRAVGERIKEAFKNVNNYDKVDPTCISWTDRCRNCIRGRLLEQHRNCVPTSRDRMFGAAIG
jgi:hypothetical protein